MTDRPTRILIADDQPDLLELLSAALAGAGYVVATASDGELALQFVRSAPPDLVILDVDMPRKDGFAVCAELKNDPQHQHLPVILLTSIAETRSKVRGLDIGADDYVTKPVNVEEFLARVRMILRRTRQDLEANPLTRLPGNPAIAARLEEAVQKKLPMAVLYVDLNQFKAYNDLYGYDAGDQVILRTADILSKAIAPREFLGHIGGDDFIVLSTPERAEALCAQVIADFDAAVPGFYREADRARGYIETRDRRGESRRFPLLSIAIGVATNSHRALTSAGQISAIGSEVKKFAKTFSGSKYVVDRRTD